MNYNILRKTIFILCITLIISLFVNGIVFCHERAVVTPAPKYYEYIDEFTKTLPNATTEDKNTAKISDGVSAFDRWKIRGAFDGFPYETTDEEFTRGEFAVIMANIMGYNTRERVYEFTDILNEWQKISIEKMIYEGIMNGYGYFIEPDRKVTPEEAYTMLARTFNLNTDVEPKSNLNGISEWAKSSVTVMLNCGYIHEKDIEKQSFTYSDLFFLLDKFIPYYYNKSLRYDFDIIAEYNGDVFINSSNMVFENAVIHGDLHLSDKVGDGYFDLRNVKVDGTLYLGNFQNKLCLTGCSANKVCKKQGYSNNLYLRNADNSEFIADAGKNPIFHDDMSVSWELPDNMIGVDNTGIKTLNENGEQISNSISSSVKNNISADRIIEYAIQAYPQKLSKIIITYNPFKSDEYNENNMIIDISNITVEEAGNTIQTGTCEYKDKDSDLTFTLGAGQMFEEDGIYCLYKYSERLNKNITRVIRTEECSESTTVNNFSGYWGGESAENINIRKVMIFCEPDSRFKITITPPNDKPFEKISDK